MATSGLRLLLDTNIWCTIGDQFATDELNRLIREEDLEIVLPPCIPMEMFRNPRIDLVRRWAVPLTTGRRTKLASEAELEAREITAEVRRLHPQWLRSWPDTGLVARFNTMWTKTIWRVLKEDAASLIESHAALPDEEPYGHRVQKSNQRVLLDSGENWTALDVWVELGADAPDAWRPGWPPERVEAWRAESALAFWHELHDEAARAIFRRDRATYADWVGAYVDLRVMTRTRANFNHFWLREVDRQRMPRRWLRWAVHVAQTQSPRKILRSNLRDNQLAAHLPDCDVFATADVAFAEALQLVRSAAPFPVAEVQLVRVRKDEDMVNALRRSVSHLR